MAAQLKNLSNIEHLSSTVIRVLGCNPTMMTLQGTNGYLVGNGKRRILIDTSYANTPGYISNMKQALAMAHCDIQEVIVTHWHSDHLDAVPEVCSNIINRPDIRISKFKRKSTQDKLLGNNLQYSFVNDGHVFNTEGATLRAIYTPGHTDDHMVLYHEEENAVFSGDTILGEGTCVFEDLQSYMKSLEKILTLKARILYPGHGDVVRDPQQWIQHYIDHRNAREKQVIEALSKNKELTAMDLVKIIYKDTPEYLHNIAEGNVLHHLEKLRKENKVVCNNSASDNKSAWTMAKL